MTLKKRYKIPFDKYGLINYPLFVCDWKDNYTFNDTLEYFDYRKGRSGVQFYFKSISNGQEYGMFISDFDKMMKTKKLFDNKVSGLWSFHKKGQNYGIYLVK